jgi:hypothetical protein
MPVNATWRNLQGASSAFPSYLATRSSHNLTILGGRAYIFGGEKEPRKPIGGELLIVDVTCVIGSLPWTYLVSIYL